MKYSTAIVIALALLPATILVSGNAAARECHDSPVSAEGSSAGSVGKLRKNRAKRRAERSWKKEVTYRHGGRFADWDNAKNTNEEWGINEKTGNTKVTLTGTPCTD
jgi:hypothetical protein